MILCNTRFRAGFMRASIYHDYRIFDEKRQDPTGFEREDLVRHKHPLASFIFSSLPFHRFTVFLCRILDRSHIYCHTLSSLSPDKVVQKNSIFLFHLCLTKGEKFRRETVFEGITASLIEYSVGHPICVCFDFSTLHAKVNWEAVVGCNWRIKWILIRPIKNYMRSGSKYTRCKVRNLVLGFLTQRSLIRYQSFESLAQFLYVAPYFL